MAQRQKTKYRYLLELGVLTATGAPFPYYLIRTDDAMDVLVDMGSPRDIIGSHE
jgi:hypothetical protein